MEPLTIFGAGPVVIGPAAKDEGGASAITRAALSGLRAAPAWPAAPGTQYAPRPARM